MATAYRKLQLINESTQILQSGRTLTISCPSNRKQCQAHIFYCGCNGTDLVKRKNGN